MSNMTGSVCKAEMLKCMPSLFNAYMSKQRRPVVQVLVPTLQDVKPFSLCLSIHDKGAVRLHHIREGYDPSHGVCSEHHMSSAKRDSGTDAVPGTVSAPVFQSLPTLSYGRGRPYRLWYTFSDDELNASSSDVRRGGWSRLDAIWLRIRTKPGFFDRSQCSLSMLSRYVRLSEDGCSFCGVVRRRRDAAKVAVRGIVARCRCVRTRKMRARDAFVSVSMIQCLSYLSLL